MKRLVLMIASMLLLASAPLAQAFVGLCCGKCGGNMPMNIPGGGVPETCEFRFKVSPSFMHMSDLSRGRSAIEPNSILPAAGMPGPGQFMATQTSMDMNMLNLSAGYSFTDDFFAGLMVMWMDKRMDMRFSNMMAGLTGQAGFTMQSQGMGDTMLMSKYRLYADDPLIPTRQVSLLASLSLPTGSIDEKNSKHPLALRRAEQLPYGMQLGSGTFDPTLGLLYQGSSSPWWWGANGSATVRLYKNARDYRLGNRYAIDLYGMRQLTYSLLAHLQFNGEWKGQVHGEMDEFSNGLSGRLNSARDDGAFGGAGMTPLWSTGSYGGTKAAVSFGFQWQPVALQIIDITAQVPFYQNLNGIQLQEDYRVMVTWYKELPTRRSIRHPQGPKPSTTSTLGF